MNVSQQIIRERLVWVENVRENLLFILEDKMDPVIHVIPTVDPLKLILKISLHHDLHQFFKCYLRCPAEFFLCF